MTAHMFSSPFKALKIPDRPMKVKGLFTNAGRLCLVLIIALLTASCAPSGNSAPMPTPSPRALGIGNSAMPPSGKGATVIVAVSDVAVGKSRIAFAILDAENHPITTPAASVRAFPQDAPNRILESQARYRGEGLGDRGVYVTELQLDTPGLWALAVAILPPGQNEPIAGGAVFQVKPKSATPSIGEQVPLSRNKTLKDVPRLEVITSDIAPDPALYQLTIAEAAKLGKPFVVVFATPAFCTSRTCGPVVDNVKELKKKAGDKLNYIHVEIFDNPEELSKGSRDFRLSNAVTEWNLPSEPWVFIVDSQGRLAYKFEGPATVPELEEAVQRLLAREG